MSLTVGSRLGPYEILSALGAGGMGEVYRATDTNLKRQVAIKVLPASVAGDSDRLARFQREAEVLAALNHPHIAHIHGLEKSDGMIALVMELVEGPTLADRIAQGPIPLDEALPIARQIAEALEAAHEQGIIHRDLKPANIKIRPDGTVKVLDFGLAKAMDPVGSAPNVSQSPTITTPAMMTGVGMILGTAAYMSPEQAKGRPADKRSDIWAFGCVLYEMLTRARAFQGADVSDTLAAVLRGEPDWAGLPAGIPPPIRTLLRRCLEKDRRRRLDSAADARLEIEEWLTAPAPAHGGITPIAAVRRPFWKRAIPVVAAAVGAGAIVGGAAWTLKPTPPLPVTRFGFTLGEGQQIPVSNNLNVTISPDGRMLAYPANPQLYLRSMSDLEAKPIPGTRQTPLSLSAPVFSPDGQSIAFYSPVDNAVKKIAVGGGAAVTICDVGTGALRGMTWDIGGIVFSRDGKEIMRVSPNGGQPEVIASVKNGELACCPQVLPGGEWVLFTIATAATADAWDKAQIVVQSLKSGERKTLLTGGSDGRYLPTGHLVYARAGVVFAVPFDLRRVATTGGSVPVIEGVRKLSGGGSGAAQFSVSSTGSLIYIPGPVSASSARSDLALTDRKGGVTPLKLSPGAYEFPRISPDGKEVAFGTDDGKEANIWIYDLSGRSQARRLTFAGRNRFPIWSSDGKRVAFQSDREGDFGIFWQRADGTGAAERLTTAESGTSHVPESWSPKGERFLFGANKGPNISGPAGLLAGMVASEPFYLWTFSLQDKNVTPFGHVQSFFPINAAFSPDGRWVAYASGDKNGVIEVYVQPFPATGEAYQISKDLRSHHPLWSRDGKELYYLPGPSRSVLAVSISTQPSFTFGNALPVSFPNDAGPAVVRNYDILPDGRVIGAMDGQISGAQQILVVLNWTEELKRLVPTK